MARILVYDLPTRLFHWLLAFGFLSALVIAQFADEHSSLFPYHTLIGLVLGMVLILRVVWGGVGTRYARFGSFLFGPGEVIRHFKGALAGGGKRYVGHNPGSGYAAFAMLALTLVIVASGVLMSRGGEALEEIHSAATYVLLALVVVHLVGILVHTLRHRENISASMVSGAKRGDPGDAIGSAKPITSVAIILLEQFALFMAL
jgi:cytochrome b